MTIASLVQMDLAFKLQVGVMKSLNVEMAVMKVIALSFTWIQASTDKSTLQSPALG
jgi:hypothetical protein